ncbi:hypothetical protein HGM15179_000141 [Zosterops borbonicus]|uniref:Phorbol-ester/DAG-type domain-containing protein n=1 Tax=Zosterops borbonicus TaxID=364589 RepID=A0A8K1GXN2_9PASS|nr:hypothetical protein HGM15179_000141 [Zosterops borbonicus]
MFPQPQDLEAPPAHTFKMTSFKKVKACGICRQAITRQGSTCRGCKLSCHTKCQSKLLHWQRGTLQQPRFSEELEVGMVPITALLGQGRLRVLNPWGGVYAS